jgi:hypothetical protein
VDLVGEDREVELVDERVIRNVPRSTVGTGSSIWQATRANAATSRITPP